MVERPSIPPFTRVELTALTLEDNLGEWNLAYSTSYRPSPLPPLSSAASLYLTRAADKDLQSVNQEVALWKSKSGMLRR